MTLVNTRQKLQPFVDEGVVHKDRKKATKKNVDENAQKRKQDPRVIDKIREYRESIQDAIQQGKIWDMDKVLKEIMDLDDTPENNEIYKALRIYIVHGQIMWAQFFKWKRECKDKQVKNAKSMFSNALVADAANEVRR